MMRKTLFVFAIVAFSLSMQAADEPQQPTLKVGAMIFADYTYQEEPVASSFNIARAYINLSGTLNQRFAFRVTGDIARETGTGTSLSGSQDYRLKFAYAQLNLDEWTTKGSYVRFGMQQTPYLDYLEQIYKFRFQGSNFAEREGYLFSADTGITVRYFFPNDYGDVYAGYYNGEGFARSETNNEKSAQVRATLRPMPKSKLGKGLRTTLFVVADHYDETAKRDRLIGHVGYEHPRFNAGFDAISTKDRDLEGRGWSVFTSPKLGKGWELLLRHDHNRPDRNSDVVRKRNITGIAYWIPNLQKTTAAVMIDRDSLSVTDKADETRYAVRLLLVF